MTELQSESAAAAQTIREHTSSSGDDRIPAEEGLRGDGESITGGTSSATATAPTAREE